MGTPKIPRALDEAPAAENLILALLFDLGPLLLEPGLDPRLNVVETTALAAFFGLRFRAWRLGFKV